MGRAMFCGKIIIKNHLNTKIFLCFDVSALFYIILPITFVCDSLENMKAHPKRQSIIDLFNADMASKTISVILKVNERTVRKTIQRYKEQGNHKDRTGRGRKVTVATPNMIKRVRDQIRRNPRRSIRKMAIKNGTSTTTMRNIVRKKLKLFPYRQQQVHLLNDRMKKLRKERCMKLRARFSQGADKSIVFSDEKVFTVDPVLNRHNDRILAFNMQQAITGGKFVGKTAHPQSIMVWGAITSDGKSPLVFVDQGVKINKEVYLKIILKDALKPWADKHFKGKHWCFQQDSAPAHKAKIVQEWLKKELPDFIAAKDWPSNSPDLNPLDFSVWSVLESKVSTGRHANMGSLKAAIIKAWDDLDNNYLRATCEGFKKRLTKCIDVNGAHFK